MVQNDVTANGRQKANKKSLSQHSSLNHLDCFSQLHKVINEDSTEQCRNIIENLDPLTLTDEQTKHIIWLGAKENKPPLVDYMLDADHFVSDRIFYEAIARGWNKAGANGCVAVMDVYNKKELIPAWDISVEQRTSTQDYTKNMAITRAAYTVDGLQWVESKFDLSEKHILKVVKNTNSRNGEFDLLPYILDHYELSDSSKKEIARDAFGVYPDFDVLEYLAENNVVLDELNVNDAIKKSITNNMDPLSIMKAANIIAPGALDNEAANSAIQYGLLNDYNEIIEYVLDQAILEKLNSDSISELGWSDLIDFPELSQHLDNDQKLSHVRDCLRYGSVEDGLLFLQNNMSLIKKNRVKVFEDIINGQGSVLQHCALQFLLEKTDIDPHNPDTDQFDAGEPLAACMDRGQFDKARILVGYGAPIKPALEYLPERLSVDRCLDLLNVEEEQKAAIRI